NSGLNELGLEAPPPHKLKKSFLGNFPYSSKMEIIEEENEGDKENKGNNEEESVAILEDEDESDDYIGSDDPEINEPDMAEEEKRKCYKTKQINEFNKLTKTVSTFSLFFSLNHCNWLLLQLYFFIKQITSSSA
ncbi:hypothetical protein VP01_19g7, partial [Puccinia sorghi]